MLCMLHEEQLLREEECAHSASVSESNMALPYFIRPFLTSHGPEELALLHRAKVFDVPAIPVLWHIFERYARRVYWEIPVFSFIKFAALLQPHRTRDFRISLPLLHSITLAAIPYLNEKAIETIGFPSRSIASNEIRKKVHVSPSSFCRTWHRANELSRFCCS
jgi:AraC-like DNA-binding protein